MRTFRKKANVGMLFLPGVGRVRDGQLLQGEEFAKYHELEEVELGTEPAPKPAPAKSLPPAPPAPKPEPEPEPELVVSECPIKDYDGMNAKKAVEAIEALEYVEDLEAMLTYEASNKDRISVMRAIQEAIEAAD